MAQKAKKMTGEEINPAPLPTRLVVKRYTEVNRDFVTVIVPIDGVPDAKTHGQIRRTVDAWLAGKLDPVALIERGTNDAPKKLARIRALVIDSKTGKPVTPRQYRYREVPMTDEHLISATLWPAYAGSSYVDGVGELPGKAYVSVIAHDGSCVHLPLVADKRVGRGEG